MDISRYLDHYKLELARKRFGPLADGLADNGDVGLDNTLKRARVEKCYSLVTPCGDGETNILAMGEQLGGSSLPGEGGPVGCVHQTLQDIESGKDEGVKGNDGLIHTQMFPGEVSLINPSLLGI